MSQKFTRSARRGRVGLAAGTLALTAAVLAGCAGGGQAADVSTPTSGDITWWGWTPDDLVAEREIAAFNEEYPDITVTYKKIPNDSYNAALRPALASSEGPDVFDVAPGGSIGQIETFGQSAIDLTPAMEELRGENWEDGLYGPGVDFFTDNGRLQAAQVGRNAVGFLWINQDLFDQYGLRAPTTLEEWKSVCETFRANGLGCFKEGVGGAFDIVTLHTIINSVEPGAWQKAVTGEIPWTSDAIVEGLSIFKELATEGILDPGANGVQQYPDVNNAFLTGTVPIVQMGQWYQQYTVTSTLTAAIEGAGVAADTALPTIVPVPFPNVGGHDPELFGDINIGLAVNAKSKNQAAATTFALWLSSTESGQQIVANNLDDFSVLLDVKTDWDSIDLVDPAVQLPKLQELGLQVDQITEPWGSNVSAKMTDALSSANQSVIGGQATPEEAAETLEQAQQNL
jgi:ABC-type glycerol-3-phosphate transport system substrate-binding protein